MQAIRPGEAVLENWPGICNNPEYEVLRGQPIPSGRLHVGQFDSAIRVGVWACTQGTFVCHETGDELQTIIKSRLRIIESDGTSHEFRPGDSFFTRKGEKLVWEVIEPMEKIFFTYNRDSVE